MEDDKPTDSHFQDFNNICWQITTNILTPSFPEAALLTMGVSSAHKFLKWLQKKVYY